jgi:hypothetical protein
MNNDLYNETIVRRGRTYHYDPDTDTYYCRSNETAISKYSWIVCVLVLAAICYYVEYHAK